MKKSVNISIYTSIYRGAAHFPQYIDAVLKAASVLHANGIQLEAVLVANDATDQERQYINTLQEQAGDKLIVKTLFVDRETLYTSWNRGIEAASGIVLGPWNIDDIRTPEGMLDAYQLIQSGCDLIDFPYRMFQHNKLGTNAIERQATYNPAIIHRKTHLGTFFMFSRKLYERAGIFDANFRITGDLDWGARQVVRESRFCKSSVIGGEFHEHGGNLSGQSASEEVINVRETIEINMVYMRHQIWDIELIRPVPDHHKLREAWETWGNPGDIQVPSHIADKLWGAQADAHWQQWKAAYIKQQRGYRIRRIPRALIDAAGLRPLLARFGIVKQG